MIPTALYRRPAGLWGALAMASLLLLAAPSHAAEGAPSFQAFDEARAAKLASGLQIIELAPGEGTPVKPGDRVVTHYVGWLKDGTKIESTHDRGRPHVFNLGRSEAIKGLDEAVSGMKPGGRRLVLIPPALGFGIRGAGAKVPPNSELIFHVELVGVK